MSYKFALFICFFNQQHQKQNKISFVQFTQYLTILLLKRMVRGFFCYIKGIFRDPGRDNALNFHKIRDVCILVMALDV